MYLLLKGVTRFSDANELADHLDEGTRLEECGG
jgi:hypothetical protein